MRRVITALLSILLLLTTGCGPTVVEPPAPTVEVIQPVEIPTLPPLLTDEEEFAALLDEVNAKNAAIDAPVADLARYRYDFERGEPLFTETDDELMQSKDEVKEFPVTISREDAKREIDWYFRLLRTRYGLYTFYGGDERFDKARESILAQLDAGGDTIKVKEEYEPMLCSALNFIRDKHLYIGSTQMCPTSALVGNTDVTFHRRDNAFYGGENSDREVASVADEPPEQYIKRAIGKDGALIWCIYARLPEDNAMKTVTVSYRDGGEEKVTLRQTSAESPNLPNERGCLVSEEGGVYTVRMDKMVMDSPENGPYTKGDDVIRAEFLDTANTLRDYPVAVYDLRKNSGGNGALPSEWFEAYTGEPMQPNYCSLALRRELDGSHSSPERDEGWARRGWTVDGDYYVQLPTPQFTDPKGPLLIVRTSKSTVSAAEDFTDMAHNLKNTLVVGAPTGGVLTGNMAWFNDVMPWSKMGFAHGTSLNYWDGDYFSEGVGLEPDVYLTGNNVDERLALFLERYALRD